MDFSMYGNVIRMKDEGRRTLFIVVSNNNNNKNKYIYNVIMPGKTGKREKCL